MSLSSLTQLLTGPLPPYTAYSPTPRSQYSNPNTPETEVSFTILGYLTRTPSVMLFQVNDAANTGSFLNIDNTKSTYDITVTDSNSPNGQNTSVYYSVDFGFDTSTNDWSLSFDINLKDGTTGSWVFTKKKIVEDDKV